MCFWTGTTVQVSICNVLKQVKLRYSTLGSTIVFKHLVALTIKTQIICSFPRTIQFNAKGKFILATTYIEYKKKLRSNKNLLKSSKGVQRIAQITLN